MPTPTRKDREHLQLLSTFHIVVGAIAAAFGLFPSLHVLTGLVMLVLPPSAFDDPTAFWPMKLIGLLFFAFPAVLMALGLSLAVVLIMAGTRLRSHTHYRFCQTAAAVACVFFPFGTVLGVFTLLALSRAGVRTLFGEEDLTAPVG